MDMYEKMQSGMQELSDDDLGTVAGGETRRVEHREICPICGKEINVTLAVHMRGHSLVPCPGCGNMMPAGPNATCYSCGYVSSSGTSGTAVGTATQPGEPTIFLDSRC